MKVTPEEIAQYTFSRSFRGYDKDLVDQFLSSLSHEWQKEIDEQESLKKRLEISEKELNRLKDVESIMLRTIKEGDDNARKLYEEAERKAAELMAEVTKNADDYYNQKKTEGDEYWAKAENKGDEIVENAELEKNRLLNEANETIENLKAAAKADIDASEKEYNSLDIAKQQLLYDLNSLLGNTNDRLTNIQTKYSPEVFDAKRVSLDGLAKATVEKVEIKAKEKANTNSKASANSISKAKTKTVSTAKPTKKVIEKSAKIVTPKVKMQEEMEPEDDGLPTVQKILALTEEQNLPTPDPEIEQNKSFFDNI
jgi:cell division initiation protein